jgi:hypothetical protein
MQPHLKELQAPGFCGRELPANLSLADPLLLTVFARLDWLRCCRSRSSQGGDRYGSEDEVSHSITPLLTRVTTTACPKALAPSVSKRPVAKHVALVNPSSSGGHMGSPRVERPREEALDHPRDRPAFCGCPTVTAILRITDTLIFG